MQAGRWLELDFENVTEEFRDLAGHDRRAVQSFMKQTIVHLIAIEVCGSQNWVKLETMRYWKAEVARFREDIVEILNESPRLKHTIRKEYDRVWERSMGSLVNKLSRIEKIGESTAERLVKGFDQGPKFTIDECVGFELDTHRQGVEAIRYTGKWLYPNNVLDVFAKADAEMERTSRIRG